MGLPIVATNIRGCRQVVTNGINGLLTPYRDINKLKDALLTLIKDKQLREKMGQAGMQKAHAEFDEHKVCKKVIDTYNNLLSGKMRRL